MQGRRAAFQVGAICAAVLAVGTSVSAQDAPLGTPDAASAPAASEPKAPAAEPKGDVGFTNKTEMVDTPQGPALQIVYGERAVFHLNDKGEPVLDASEKGQLAMAHPAGSVKETFTAPGPGKLAIAIDGSAEKQASYLKIWNGLDHPVIYHAGILAFVKGKLTPMTVKVCAAPAHGVNDQTWPAPVQAIAVANFTTAPNDNTCS